MPTLRKTLEAGSRPSDPGERANTAARASLRYVCCDDAGIRRVKHGSGFVYYLPNGKRLTNREQLERIRRLALPPAWRDVWICLHAHGHLQATGYDARGRKQYRYAARWRTARDDVKYADLLDLAARLPRLRQRLELDTRRAGLTRDKVLAALVSLLAQTGIRVGNARYREENGSFGLTTLLDRHVKIARSRVELSFRGNAATFPSARKRQLNSALSNVAQQLGNTLAICRKSYVHPAVMQAFLEGTLPTERVTKRAGLSSAECGLVSLLEQTVSQRAAA